jgi:CheY-like chemotaxis protein
MAKRVLVVDDEKVIADTLGAILRKAGYEVAAAYDALSALSQCESCTPDLVITDVIMPGMNGIEMAILIQRRYPVCRVLLFSGQAATTDLLEEARRSGHDFELLTKPVHPTDLLASLQFRYRMRGTHRQPVLGNATAVPNSPHGDHAPHCAEQQQTTKRSR